MSQLLAVAGEPSGDDLAAEVISLLHASAWGVGGPGMVREGLEAVGELPSVMGFAGALASLPRLLQLRKQLMRQLTTRQPRAALLVGFSEFNARLARSLRDRDVRTLWYAPPQIWVWRAHRARRLAPLASAYATLFSFEQKMWEGAGAVAHHVGHPAAALDPSTRESRRADLSIEAECRALLLLPGSRPREVARHGENLMEAASRLTRDQIFNSVHLALAPSLPSEQRHAMLQRCAQRNIHVLEGPAASDISAFDAAVCCSGTASLECAVSAVPAIIVYDAGPLTALGAQHLLRLPHVGLPNLLLGERLFPELLGDAVRPKAIVEALQHLPSRAALLSAATRLRAQLLPKPTTGTRSSTPSARVAELLSAWL